MPKQKRWALKQRLDRALEHIARGAVLIGEVNDEIKAAHPENPPPLDGPISLIVLAFGAVDKYREDL